jgi:hypothetical protein
MAGGQEQCLDFFGDTVSHPPDCCSFIRIGVGCGRALSQPPLSAEAPLRLNICPAKLVTWHPVIPNGSYLLHGPRQTLPGCVLIAILGDIGTQIGLGRGRQNERDLVMLKDPPTDLHRCLGAVYSITTFIREITPLLQIRQFAHLRSTTCSLQSLIAEFIQSCVYYCMLFDC